MVEVEFGDFNQEPHGVPDDSAKITPRPLTLNMKSHEVAKMVLDHTMGAIVARTYPRSDRLEQKRKVMQDW